MVRHASWLLVAALAISACSLIVAFDPESQPCDSTGACLPTHDCINGICKARDGGVDGGGGGTEICGNGLDDDGDLQVDCADADCNGRSCSDGDSCTTGEVCTGGVCPRGTPMVCNSPSRCETTPGTCDAGTCIYAPLADGVSCGAAGGAERCCRGACVNLTNDARNCGGCGLTCASGQTCQDVGSNSCGPMQTSGRCTCTSTADGGCPTAQSCNTVALVCAPTGDAGCAASQHVARAETACPAYCSY